MADRFNYTNRKKILKTQAIVRVIKGETFLCVELEQTFSGLYNPESDVVIEAYRGNKAQRVSLGKAKDLQHSTSVVFNEFQDAADMKFRLRVLNSVSRKLEGLAKQLRDANEKQDPSDAESILPVRFDDEYDNLGDRFWMLKCTGTTPVLVLSKKKISGFSQATSNEFQALVLPEVLRQVLTFAYIQRWYDFPEWEERWRRFVEEKLGCSGAPTSSPTNPDADYIETTSQWIDDAASCFAKRFNLKDVSIKGLTNEE